MLFAPFDFLSSLGYKERSAGIPSTGVMEQVVQLAWLSNRRNAKMMAMNVQYQNGNEKNCHREMKVNWATSPGNTPKMDTSSKYFFILYFITFY
uniref:Uncharacterized protein n=1 Tax=Strigamia maritima TaxID=126957 RepID=T1JH86_STRMM